MRPADEIEVAAHKIQTGEPVLPEAIVSCPEQRYSDERGVNPVTAPATRCPVVAHVPGTSSAAMPSTPKSTPATSSQMPGTPLPKIPTMRPKRNYQR